jgi:pantetheine-phosphate adenylyltransferase
MITALYPGSFDPITFGHLDVVDRAARLFGRLIIAVAQNAEKSPLFPSQRRIELIRESIGHRPNVEVVSFDGLLVDFARTAGATAIVRGLRAVTDFEYEFQMALMNKTLSPELETVFLTSREAFTYISSRVIKEVARLGGCVDKFVPPCVASALHTALGTHPSPA